MLRECNRCLRVTRNNFGTYIVANQLFFFRILVIIRQVCFQVCIVESYMEEIEMEEKSGRIGMSEKRGSTSHSAR